ncbi:MAG TPA: glycosyl hydrolase family 8 [Oligoflexus sp.]|nr:glycosyl hydrolase family 8 [Oligoflexus sp.]
MLLRGEVSMKQAIGLYVLMALTFSGCGKTPHENSRSPVLTQDSKITAEEETDTHSQILNNHTMLDSQGLRASFFSEGQSPILSRIDQNVNFDWKEGSPATEVPADRFSVRWEGEFEAPANGDYEFYTVADDGIKLWVGDTLLINDWRAHGALDMSQTMRGLSAGRRYPIKLEYFENIGVASVKLGWRVPGGEREIIPTERLFPSQVASLANGPLLPQVPSSPGSPAPSYDFPAGLKYLHGILPNKYTQDQMNQDLVTMWGAWRNVYLKEVSSSPKVLRVASENGETSLSEGTGYGLLISAYMANASNTGKGDFDAILRYYKNYKKRNTKGENVGLMAWRIGANGDILDNWVAPDGDLDAAFALLVADKKWGSAGEFNYKQEAIAIINSLMKWSVHNRSPGASQLIARSDMALTDQESAGSWTMSSYQTVGYFNQFKKATNDPRWLETLKAGYKMYDHFHKANPSTALTPYVLLTKPGTTQYSRKDGKGYNFGYDSCRTPWRVGIDYLWYGNANALSARSSDGSINPQIAHDMPNVNTKWLQRISEGNPMNVRSSYELNGTPSATSFVGSQRNFVSPMAVAAMVDPSNQEWLNTLYDWMRLQTPGTPYTKNGLRASPSYFEDTVMMVNMIAVTGNMPNLPDMP